MGGPTIVFDLKIILFFEFKPLFALSFRPILNCWMALTVMKIAIQATLHLVRGILVTAGWGIHCSI